MKRFLLPLMTLISLAVIAATVAPNVPISQFPIAPVLFTNAWIPIIQPLPGRTTNDNFRVAPSAFAEFLGTNNTSASNIFNTIIVTNLYVENNLTVTNSFVTNINTTIVNTNVTQEFNFTTNIFESSVVINTNTFVTNISTTIVNTNTTIVNQGDTIINTNVTQTFSFTTNIIDNSLTIFTNVLEITTNSITIYTNTYVTNATIFINGTNVAAINPTIGRLPYKSGTNTFDDSSMYFIDTNTTGTATLEVTDLANGGVVISLLSGIVTNLVNGTGALTNDGAGNLGWADISGANLWTNNAGVLEPVDLTLPLMITNQIRFGPGSTNVLYRSGSNLAYTNGATQVEQRIANGLGRVAYVGLSASGQPVFGADGGATSASITDGTDVVTLFGGTFIAASYPLLLGSDSAPWGPDFYLAGYLSGTNQSRLKLSHTGTNGAVVFDSQTKGDAGSPRTLIVATNDVYKAPLVPFNLLIPPVIDAMTMISTNIMATNLGTGVTDLFTVPAGYRFLPSNLYVGTTNTTTVTITNLLKIGATYYPVSGSGSATTNSQASGLATMIYEPGDVIAMNTSLAGANVRISGTLYANTNALYSPRVLSLTNGDNVIYIAPAGKNGYGVTKPGQAVQPGASARNYSGAPRVFTWHIVPAGGAADGGNQFQKKTIADGASDTFNFGTLSPGDAVVLNTDAGSNQSAWTTIAEW